MICFRFVIGCMAMLFVLRVRVVGVAGLDGKFGLIGLGVVYLDIGGSGLWGYFFPGFFEVYAWMLCITGLDA